MPRAIPTPNIKLLELLLQVIQSGSVSRAAKSLGMTQSFVSRQVARLESDWGEKLFERNGRGMQLTAFGQQISPEITQLVQQARKLEDAVRDRSRLPAGQVRVGVVPSMSQPLLPLLFSAVKAAAPAVHMQVVEGFTGSLEKQLAAGALDLAIMNRYGGRAREGEDVLGRVDTMLIGRRGSACLADGELDFGALGEIPLVLPLPPDGLLSFLYHQAGQRKIELNVLLEVNTLSAMVRIAKTGAAFMFLPSLAVADDIASGELAATRIVNPVMQRTISLASASSHPLSRASRLVMDAVRGLMVEILQG